jgi:hypothetical protein
MQCSGVTAPDDTLKRFLTHSNSQRIGISAWSFMRGPLSFLRLNELGALVSRWSTETLRAIAAGRRAREDEFEPDTPVQDRFAPLHASESPQAQVLRVLKKELRACMSDVLWNPASMLIRGIVVPDNCEWISDEDCRKLALAHGCVAHDRQTQVDDIMHAQMELIEEIIRGGYDLGSPDRDARLGVTPGYCLARGVLEKCRAWFGLRVLPSERADPTLREPLCVSSGDPICTYECSECYTQVSLANFHLPQYARDRYCQPCSTLALVFCASGS